MAANRDSTDAMSRLRAERDYYRRRWLVHGIRHAYRPKREQYVEAVMRTLKRAVSRDA